MLREMRKLERDAAKGRRVGIVLADNGDGTYDISMESARINNVPSVSFAHYRVGARVVVNFAGGRPAIEP